MRALRRSRRGAMLIIATGILTLLAVLAFSFVNMMRIERRASTNYMDGFRADMVAEAGLTRALEEMRIFSGSQVVYDPNAAWIYEKDATGSPQYDIRLVDAEDPSMIGDMGQTYNGGLDRYRVKIVDTQALIDLNHPNDFDRLMDQLGAAIAQYATQADNRRNPVVSLEYQGENGGAAMLAFRRDLEGGRFHSKSELLDLYAMQTSYGGEDAIEDYKLISNYVTAHTWRDQLAATPSASSYLHGRANLEVLLGRAPININAASKVVLAAIIAGVGGRIPLVYIEESPTLLDLNYGVSLTTSDIKVEDRYSFRSGWMFIPPIDYSAQTSGDTIAYELNDSLPKAGEIADILISARQSNNGIKSHAHLRSIFFDANLDTSADPFASYGINDAIDPSIRNAGPVDETSGEPNGELFNQLFREGFVDMLCANFNPNWQSAHHGTPGSYNVDKAELLRLYSPENGRVGSAVPSMTTEACFNSRGIFEITSLGELVGEPNGGDYDALYAQSEIRTVVKVFDSKGHTSQKDFITEWTDYTATRDNVMIRPDDPRYNDFASSGQLFDRMGSIEIQPESLSVIVLEDSAKQPDFVLTFQQTAQAVAPEDLFDADYSAAGWVDADELPDVNTAYDNVWEGASPRGFPNTGQRLLDGVYMSEKGNFLGTPRMRRMLRYRAAADNYSSTSSIVESDLRNVGSKKGALEFWYRPDHDWAVNDEPVPVVSGLFHVSTAGENQALLNHYNQSQVTVGTQMFVTRNLGGQLRVTRLYFESVGGTGANWPDQVHYRAKDESLAEAQAFASSFGGGLTQPVDLDNYQWHSNEPNMFWPPLDIVESQVTTVGQGYDHNGTPFRGLWARTETAVRFDELKHIKANEWHHFVIAWDDNATSEEGICRIWVDGDEMTGTEKQVFADKTNAEDLEYATLDNQADRLDFRFVRLNQEPGGVFDVFDVGCIVREQAIANTGVFTFSTDGDDKQVLLAANGTIDDVRVYNAATPFSGTGGLYYPADGQFAFRYDGAVYQNVLDMFDRFPASGYPLQLGVFSWTGVLPDNNSDLPDAQRASVLVNVWVLDSSGNIDRQLVTDYEWTDPEAASGIPLDGLLYNDERILYEFDLAASNVIDDTYGNFSQSPLIDDVSVSYFTEAGGDVLLKEKVFD